ncbi:MAG: copper resistance system multicopper oxidase [Gammaproteobacteria bacterium]|nr:copper resistance system multicopper oxidase [Gammaproteobacteria bacterium]
MDEKKHSSRRRFLHDALRFATAAGIGTSLPLPAWARTARPDAQAPTASTYDLAIGHTPVTIGGRQAVATGINGTVPGPLLRMREGERIALNVRNDLHHDSSIHWHGLILPYIMDGVPGISFDGIKPGETFRYDFDLLQNGTYWYHSHSGFQEQTGVYGPIIIYPKDEDAIDYDREFVVLLSDWTFESPETVFANLKKMPEYYNYQRRTLADLFADASEKGWKQTAADRRMWGNMRMSPTDIADVTGATYTYLMNGQDAAANWTALFRPGERIRLRFINGSAMSFFNVRIPGLPMQIVQADGIDVQPVTVEEFQIGVAETYDAIVEPAERAYTLFAESMDRSGFVSGTLAPGPGMRAEVPALRKRPLLTMADMGMAHGDMTTGDAMPGHTGMHHGISMPGKQQHDHVKGVGVDNVAEQARDLLAEPGLGLTGLDHRVLTYADLKSLQPNSDRRKPGRTLELHLTGNMERYMWSFDGVKFSEVKGPLEFVHGERLRLVLVNDTMMSHPIHLHGMFVELVNGNGRYNPRKHTVVLKPAEKLSVDITADAPGDWAFHCHLLYHMVAGMMRKVSVIEAGEVSS